MHALRTSTGDGKEDLVIQHPSATGPGRLNILMAR